MASAVLIEEAISVLEPLVQALVVKLIQHIRNHPKPTAATVAATNAVVSTPDDADTNSPTLADGSRNPYFVA